MSVERSDVLPTRRQPRVAVGFGKTDVVHVLGSVLGGHSLLPLVGLWCRAGLYFEGYVLDLVEHFLKMFLVPHLLYLDLILTHKDLG